MSDDVVDEKGYVQAIVRKEGTEGWGKEERTQGYAIANWIVELLTNVRKIYPSCAPIIKVLREFGCLVHKQLQAVYNVPELFLWRCAIVLVGWTPPTLDKNYFHFVQIG